MNDLLVGVLDAHGGVGRWARVHTITVRLSIGGPFWARICCAQHILDYVALRTMLPSVDCGRCWQGIELAGATYFRQVAARDERQRRAWWEARPGFAIRRPNAIEHISPEFRAGFEVHVRRAE
jgi:hypothetical protein